MRRRAAAVIALCLAMPSVAWGQADAVEADFQRAAQLRSAEPEAALAIYQGLHARTQAPRALAQVGMLEGQMGRWVLAEAHLAAALEARGDAWVEPRRAALEANLAEIRTHVSELTVAVNVPGAALRVNDAPAGALPLEHGVRVAVGQVVVDVDAPGYEHVREIVQATAGRTRLEVTLVHVAPSPVAGSPVPPPVAAAVLPPLRVPRDAPPEAPRRAPAGTDEATLRVLGIVLLGAGGVGLGVGVAGVVLRNDRVGAFTQDNCWVEGGRAQGGTGCQGVLDTGNVLEAVATAGVVGGAVLAATGGALVLAAALRGREPAPARVTLECAPGLAAPGVLCAGRF